MEKGIMSTDSKKDRNLERHTRYFFVLDDKIVTLKKWIADPREAAVPEYTQNQIKLMIRGLLRNNFSKAIDYHRVIRSGATFEEIVAYAVRNLGFNVGTKGIKD